MQFFFKLDLRLSNTIKFYDKALVFLHYSVPINVVGGA